MGQSRPSRKPRRVPLRRPHAVAWAAPTISDTLVNLRQFDKN